MHCTSSLAATCALHHGRAFGATTRSPKHAADGGRLARRRIRAAQACPFVLAFIVPCGIRDCRRRRFGIGAQGPEASGVSFSASGYDLCGHAIQLCRDLLRSAYLAPFARAAEDAGFDSFVVPDSVLFPAHSDTRYPYTADGDRAFLEDKPIIEPFTLIPFLAAQTTRLRFTTFVVKLAIRPPVLVAKQAASIAVLSDDRLRLGVGISPWPEDFAAMDLPWETRHTHGRDVDIVRGLTAGGWFEYDGECGSSTVARSRRLGAADPDPHRWSLRAGSARAAHRGDGWIHAGGDGGELAEMIPASEQLRAEYGREHDPFEIHAVSIDAYTPDGVRRLEDRASPTRSSASAGRTRPSPTPNRSPRRSICSSDSPTA